MINLQYRIFTSEIDIIEWDRNKFKSHLFTINGYCQLLMFCCYCLSCVSPFHKNLKSQILVLSPYLPAWESMHQTQPIKVKQTSVTRCLFFWTHLNKCCVLSENLCVIHLHCHHTSPVNFFSGCHLKSSCSTHLLIDKCQILKVVVMEEM